MKQKNSLNPKYSAKLNTIEKVDALKKLVDMPLIRSVSFVNVSNSVGEFNIFYNI